MTVIISISYRHSDRILRKLGIDAFAEMRTRFCGLTVLILSFNSMTFCEVYDLYCPSKEIYLVVELLMF